MAGFGDLSLGAKLGIILGGIAAVILIAVGLYLVLSRRKANRKRIEEANKPTDKEKLVPTSQKSSFGGSAQRSQSPAPSYRLAPETSIVDWGKEGKLGSSASSINSVPRAARIKQSPLRLELQDAKFNPSSVGGMGGSYLPPLPSPRSNRAESPMFQGSRPAGWVSPLDVHFSRPSTPGTPSASVTQYNRPSSYLPKLSMNMGKTGTLVAPAVEAKSEAASVVSSGVTTPVPALLKVPAQHTMPAIQPTQKSLRSVFTPEQQPTAQFQTPSVPLKDLPSPRNFMNSGFFPSDNRQWRPASPSPTTDVVKARWRNATPNATPTQASFPSPVSDRQPSPSFSNEFNLQIPGTPTLPVLHEDAIDAKWDRSQPVIRNSTAIQRVSIVQPGHASQKSLDTDQRVRQVQNELKSLEAPITPQKDAPISPSRSKQFPARMSSQTAQLVLSQASSSSTTPDLTPSKESSHHGREVSNDSIILGKDDETQPERDSPFSQSHKTHSANSSFSSYSSTLSPVLSRADTNKSQTSLLDLENFPFPASPRQVQQGGHVFEFALPPVPSNPTAQNYLQVVDKYDRVSRVSMGDFYDSYYEQYEYDGSAQVPEPLSPTYQHQREIQNQIRAVQGQGQGRAPYERAMYNQRQDSYERSTQQHASPSNQNGSQSQRRSPSSSPTKRGGLVGEDGKRAMPRRPAPLNLGKLGGRYTGYGEELLLEIATPTNATFGPLRGVGGGQLGGMGERGGERFPARF